MWRGEPRVAHSFQKSFCLGHPQPWLAENWRFAPSLPVLQIYFFPPLPATLFCLFVCKTGLLCKHITHGPRTVQIADCSKTFPNHRWSHFFFQSKGRGKKMKCFCRDTHEACPRHTVHLRRCTFPPTPKKWSDRWEKVLSRFSE